MVEYFHADRLNYAVCGTPNRLEYDQGFFVKLGDGSADFKPIAHLYKSQVYMLAEALDISLKIRSKAPTTDTFSLAQTQEEFYFALPYHPMDLLCTHTITIIQQRRSLRRLVCPRNRSLGFIATLNPSGGQRSLSIYLLCLHKTFRKSLS